MIYLLGLWRASRPGSLEDVKRLAGYDDLQQQLNDLDPKLLAELEDRVKQYFEGVKIMESDIVVKREYITRSLNTGILKKYYYRYIMMMNSRLK